MSTANKRGCDSGRVDDRSAAFASGVAGKNARSKSSSAARTAGTAGVAAATACCETRGSLATESTSFDEGCAKKAQKLTSQAAVARPDGPSPSCPRCHAGPQSTKFAFYNNKDIKQPRYYCKECQRYWTVGGVLRNVPPGSGRRKSRSAASRDGRRGPSHHTGCAPESTGGSNETALPDNLMNSNPLASVLMTNLGLGGGERTPVQPLHSQMPAQTQSVDLSNQTADTTQRLHATMPSLGASGAPMQPAGLPVFSAGFAPPSAPLVQPLSSTIAPAAGSDSAHGGNASGQPLLAAVAAQHETTIAQGSATASSQQQAQKQPQLPQSAGQSDPAQRMASQPAAATVAAFAPPADGTGYFLSLMQQQQQQQTQQQTTQPFTQQPGAATAANPMCAAMSGASPAPAFGLPQTPQSNMLASMASMPPAFQMLIAQNAAWLYSQAQSQGMASGVGATFPGMGLTGADGAQFAGAVHACGGNSTEAGGTNVAQPTLKSSLPSDPSVTSADGGALRDTSVPPIAPLRTAPAPVADTASTATQPWFGQHTAALPPSYLWAPPYDMFAPPPQLGLGAVMPTLSQGSAGGTVVDARAQAQALQAFQSQMQFAPSSAQQNGDAAP